MHAADRATGASDGNVGGPRRIRLMIMLVAIYASNFIDRTIINVLQQPIKIELALQDWQLGLLGGTAFALFYTVIALYVARLAERRDRIALLTGCILIWSAFTAACGMVGGFVQLLALRVGVAVGEAGCAPTSHSLISDHYPSERRPGALAIHASGATIGLVLGALLGGIIAGAWGWRWAFICAGVPGLALAAITFLTLRDPRVAADRSAADVPTLREVAMTLAGKATWRWIVVAAPLTVFAIYGTSAFAVPHFMRSFGLGLRAASLLGGVGAGLALGAGTLLGGYASQYLARRDRRWMMWTPGIAMLAASPLVVVAFLATDLRVAATAFVLGNVALGIYNGPLFSTNHAFVGPRMRATASAIMLLIVTLIGLGLGPLVVGLASDALAAAQYAGADYAAACRAGTSPDPACLAASATGLRRALAAVGMVAACAGVLYMLAARTIRADVID